MSADSISKFVHVTAEAAARTTAPDHPFDGGLRSGPYTPAADLGAVIGAFTAWFCVFPRSGSILEVGAADGDSTRILAESFPHLLIHALEWGNVAGTNIQQRREVPAAPAANALRCDNVRLLRANSLTVNFASLAPAAVFIDGNHTLPFVLADSANAIAALSRNTAAGGVIAWHDYRPAQRSGWCAVTEAVDLIGRIHRLEIFHVPSTAVAVAVVPPSMRQPFPAAVADLPAAGPLPATSAIPAEAGRGMAN